MFSVFYFKNTCTEEYMKYKVGQVVTPLNVTKREKQIWKMYEGIPMYVISCSQVDVKVELQGRQVIYPINHVKLLENAKGKQFDKDYANMPTTELEKLKLLELQEEVEIIKGREALSAIASSESGEKFEFTPFKSGTVLNVRAYQDACAIEYVYGIYDPTDKEHNVPSFVAQNPSIKSSRGFPTDNLTCWDKAFKYYKDQSKDYTDEMAKLANRYKAKMRVAFGFYDLDKEAPIIIDLSQSQASIIINKLDSLIKDGENLAELSFKLEKSGKGLDTVVIFDLHTRAKEKQYADKITNAPEEFDDKLFDNLFYVNDENKMLKLLVKAGFDVTLIGLEAPVIEEDLNTGGLDLEEDDLPFQF